LLSALKINCEASAGGTITLYTDANQSVVLKDDGLNADQVANDGVFSLSWRPTIGGTYALNYGGGDTVTVVVNGGNPQPKTYKFYNNIPYEYETITGTALNVGDDTVSTVSIPFPVHFNNDATGFSTIYVGSNGTISFTNANNPGYANKALPVTTNPTLAAVYWDDLIPVSGGDVFVATTGTAPNRKVVIEWRNLKHYNATGTAIFQAVLYENSPDIRYNYKDTIFGAAAQDSGASATVGVQVGAAAATQYSFNTATIISPLSLVAKLE
jgi:hypothetical protein